MIDDENCFVGARVRHFASSADVKQVHTIMVVTNSVRPIISLYALIAVTGNAAV
jgi:hypothetical protein